MRPGLEIRAEDERFVFATLDFRVTTVADDGESGEPGDVGTSGSIPGSSSMSAGAAKAPYRGPRSAKVWMWFWIWSPAAI